MDQTSMSTAQLEALTYPEIVANTLDDQDLARRCPLDNGWHQGTPALHLGDLDKLPLELLSKALVQGDLRSLTDFRRVNRRAMEVVDSIMQYQVIVTHTPDSLRGILAIGTGRWTTCQKLYDQLCIAECEHCGDFGGYLYLVTCKRVCFFYFSHVPDYPPLPPSDALQKFGLGRSILKSLPRFKSIPGCYTREETDLRTRLTFVDSESARQAGIALHGSVSAMKQHASEIAYKRLRAYTEKAELKAGGALIPAPRRPRLKEAYDGCDTNPRRCLAIVRAPWLDLRTRSLEWGFHCLSCLYMDDPWQWTAKFTAETFHGHFEECGKKMEIGDSPMRRHRSATALFFQHPIVACPLDLSKLDCQPPSSSHKATPSNRSTDFTSAASPKIKTLHAEIDAEAGSYYRFLIASKSVKYIAIGPQLYPTDSMAFAPALIPQLPAFPAGD